MLAKGGSIFSIYFLAFYFLAFKSRSTVYDGTISRSLNEYFINSINFVDDRVKEAFAQWQ